MNNNDNAPAVTLESPPAPQVTRDIRQRQTIPPEKLAQIKAVVIGVGAIGRQVAMQLAATGVKELILIDHDKVGVENLAPQMYDEDDVGQFKVHATADTCRALNGAVGLATVPHRFQRSYGQQLGTETYSGDETPMQYAVFACVDSIETRKMIWHAVQKADFFVDGRMAAEVVRVLASDNLLNDTYYGTTLFDASEAYVGACTQRSLVYTANVAAGLMMAAFTKWLRGMPVNRDVMLNLLAADLIVG